MTAQLELELFAAPLAETPPAEPAGSAPVLDLAATIEGIIGDLHPVIEAMEWAEDEIAAATRRHPGQADRLWHAFLLLQPTQDRMSTEFVYRAHARELLERVAAGGDTRPGTAVEVVAVMLAVSLVTPFRSAAAGLYLRMWHQAGLPDLGMAEAWQNHEALEASTIDDYEALVRRKLTRPDRRLGDVDCMGQHHGEPATACRYARPAVIDGTTTS